MEKKALRRIAAGCLLFCTVFLTGCSIESGDGLASLPKLPGEYVTLQKKLDDILAKGFTYAVAEDGPNRQAVQLVDVDGDGNDETISFFRSATSGEYSVYIHKKQGEGYKEIGHTKGYGKYLREVHYVKSSPNGSVAIVLCWAGEDNTSYGMTVHMVGKDGLIDALTVKYANMSINDLDGDGVEEIVTISYDRGTNAMSIAAYGFMGESCTQLTETALSADIKNVVAITEGITSDSGRALYVDSLMNTGGYLTDIVKYRNGSFHNATMDMDSMTSSSTWRQVSVQCRDMDGDGIYEIPLATMLPGYGDPNSSETRWKLKWTRFLPDNQTQLVMTTFHSTAEDWFFLWPERWGENVTVLKKNEAGISKTIFFVPPAGRKNGEYRLEPDETNTLLNIYAFTGDSRREYFENSGMGLLKETSNTIFAYSIPSNNYGQYTLTEEEMQSCFHMITKEWGMEGYN